MGIFKWLAGLYVSVRHLHYNSLQIIWFYKEIGGLTLKFFPLQRGTVFTNSTKITQRNFKKIIDILYLNLIKDSITMFLCNQRKQKHLKASRHDITMKCETSLKDISPITRIKNITDFK
jgi:hypothetical protein